MLKFPDELRIKAIEKGSQKPVSRLAMKLILFAPRKNNYTIPMVTDKSGEIHLSAEDVRQSIKDDWELFPMDYISPLEDCFPEVEIKVCSSEDVQRTIRAMEMFRSASTISDKLIRDFEQSVNAKYLPVVERLNAEQTPVVEIEVLPVVTCI